MNHVRDDSNHGRAGTRRTQFSIGLLSVGLLIAGIGLISCGGGSKKVEASDQPSVTVGVTKVAKKTLSRQLTLSSELVPFQEIDVYAKESGYIQKLDVDFGTHVKEGQVMAILEIPELLAQLQEDQADITNANHQVSRAQNELKRDEAQYNALHLEYTRLNGVFENQPGIVAQQEVDDAQSKDLSSASQVDAAKAGLEAAQSNLTRAQARLVHDQTLYGYSRIVAPFSGVVTQRYANLGALVQAGTTSSTQAMPIVRLSQDDLFRLVIPVPESYVRYIRVGDPVDVRVPSLNQNFPGKVTRFSVDVRQDTRTMHTEVDVPNRNHALLPGLYAEATLSLDHREDIATVPLQSVNHEGSRATVYVVNPNGEIEDRTITLGIQTSTDAEVTSGLNEGEEVIVSDRSGLRPGQRVRPQVVQVMQYQDANKE